MDLKARHNRLNEDSCGWIKLLYHQSEDQGHLDLASWQRKVGLMYGYIGAINSGYATPGYKLDCPNWR